MMVDVGELGLQSIEAVGRTHTETDVTLEIAWMVLGCLLSGPMLWEIFGCLHDELQLVEGVGQCLRINCVVVESVRRREEDEGLVVEAGKYHALELHGEPLQR